MLVRAQAEFDVAVRLREGRATFGEVYGFISGLYFRGKLAYSRRFTRPPDPTDRVVAGGILIITPNAGLRAADVAVTRKSIEAFAGEPIDLDNVRYRRPLEQGARALCTSIGPDCDVVLLGSIASGKYVEVLLPIFGDRLLFPPSFIGRGDMSRGGLLLRSARAESELEYSVLEPGTVRRGCRPPKLEPLPSSRPHSLRRRVRFERVL